MIDSPSLPLIQNKYFDSVVMLTWSNWFTELRSNRYHYATRFAKHFPVIFVQPDLKEKKYQFENTEIENLWVLHIYSKYTKEQTRLLNQALLEKKCIKPLLWVYNVNFTYFIHTRYTSCVVYHGTEDYLASDSVIKFERGTEARNQLLKTLSYTDLLQCVSEGVEQSFLENAQITCSHITISNGCDYHFYAPNLVTINHWHQHQEKIVFYQGSIFHKLNFELLFKLAHSLPDWTFLFAGRVYIEDAGWNKLLSLHNIKYVGLCSAEEIRTHAYNSTVGIIPFIESDWLVERSFPLKAFEYLACGLPVVTIPINSLKPFKDVFYFAKTVDEFKNAILEAKKSKYDQEKLLNRLNVAKAQGYDQKFDQCLNKINETIVNTRHNDNKDKLSILILYEPNSSHVNTIAEHLESFALYSRHAIYYSKASGDAKCKIDLNSFDIIIIHYSIRLSVKSGNFTLSPSYANALKSYGGYKIVFIQDEYEGTENARQWFEELGIHHVFTCVPEAYIPKVYPHARFPHVQFTTTLTGYVPHSLSSLTDFIPLKDREIEIAYRGRTLPYWYGELGQQKYYIGVRMKELCELHHIKADIECAEDKRIYGSKWYDFLRSSRATLGTESGCNIFDDSGQIRKSIEQALRDNPSLSYQEAYSKYLKHYDNQIIMNQISPKVFEAIALGTVLILFEGAYSNVLEKNEHYIPLKTDYSNVDEVFKKLRDISYLEKIRQQAYQDIIQSNNYSYSSFIAEFENALKKQNIKARNLIPFDFKHSHVEDLKHLPKLRPDPIDYTIHAKRFIPKPIKNVIKKMVKNK